MVVTGAGSQGFTISKLELNGSLVLFPKMFFGWDISSAEDIRAHHFDILDIIKPTPSKFGFTQATL